MKRDTFIAHAGRHPAEHRGAVNPPVYRASTIIQPSLDALEHARRTPFEGVRYGRLGTPTTQALEEAVAGLEGGWRSIAMPSGLAAITAALLAFVEAGDHVLMTDGVYLPTRRFCDGVLARLGVETTYYDPALGAGIAALVRPNTRLVFVESPSSMTFEVQDVPAIAAAARAAGAVVVMDNTWATPLFFKPFEHGVDVSLQAATKYLVGHSDAMLGVITTTEPHWQRLKTTVTGLGLAPGSEEAWLGLRGLRTLSVRLDRHQSNALAVAAWLEGRPEVARVLHPALPSHPGHDLWRRDFLGASGLFGVELKPVPKPALAAMLDGLGLFAMGYSWGGFESLVIPGDGSIVRTATDWHSEGPYLRLHVGLEDQGDLIADLEAGFARLIRAAGSAP